MDHQPYLPAPTGPDLPIEIRELQVGTTGRRAFIVDNLVEPGALAPLYHYFRGLPYEFFDTDRQDTQFVRHLVHYFEDDEYETNRAIASLIAQAADILRDRELAFTGIQRVYANFNLFGDYQFAHTDGDVWTALVFVNAAWGDDWGGEFLLYEEGPQAVAYAIPVRPGRVVVFDGRLTHRGGVPSKYCVDPRITLAIKFERAEADSPGVGRVSPS